jgi:hypothetical protein
MKTTVFPCIGVRISDFLNYLKRRNILYYIVRVNSYTHGQKTTTNGKGRYIASIGAAVTGFSEKRYMWCIFSDILFQIITEWL